MAYRQKHPYIAQIFYILKFTAKQRLARVMGRVKKDRRSEPWKG